MGKSTKEVKKETVTETEVNECKIGTVSVSKQSKLNVRKKPTMKADIVCTLEHATQVEIDISKSNDEFYKITLPSGIEGYCMKKFVKIKK